MAVPDFQSLMLPVLQVVSEGGPIAAPDVRARVAERLSLSDDDLAERSSGGHHTVFGNRVAWANVYLQRAGLIKIVRRGVYAISDTGTAVLARNVTGIDLEYLEEFAGYAEWRKRAARPGEIGAVGSAQTPTPMTSAANPEEQIERSHRELTSVVEAELLERLRATTPAQFEQIIIDLLVAMGYGGGRAEMAKAIGRSGASEVRDFVGSLDMHRASKGIFVTTSTFPKSAYDVVTRASKRVVLIDGEELAQLMVAHGVGVRVKTRYEINELDDDYFVN